MTVWIVVSGLGGCRDQEVEVPSENVVVRVGEAVLTLEDLATEIPAGTRDRISKEAMQDYAVRWINSQVLYQEAKRRGLDQSKDIARELQRVERELAVNALLQHEIYTDTARVSEARIQEFYTANLESFRRTEQEAQVYHISVPTQAEADSFYRMLRYAGDFPRVARGRALASGDTSAWHLDISFSEAPEAMHPVFRLSPGAVSAPIELDDGFHLFNIIQNFQSGTIRDLNLVREEVARKVSARARDDRYRTLLAELRAGAKIETDFQLIENISLDSLLDQAAARKGQ
ncbi:MAG: peptidylprolyl isomerase [bacterium]